jgi:hypothetical protein
MPRPRSPPRIAYVVGTEIPDDTITERLYTLYAAGDTPGLLTGNADVESDYRQFREMILYDIESRWPIESYDGGSHVGLMQIATSLGMEYVWDWTTNTQYGATLFAEKLAAATRISTRIVAANPGLLPRTPEQLENFAVVLYGPHASADLGRQYYTVATDPVLGLPKWVVNSAGNSEGVAYANDCRGSIRARPEQPGGSV